MRRGTRGPAPHANRLAMIGAALVMALAPVARALAQDAVPPAVASVRDLPLKEVRATVPGDVFAVFLTGDGGWTTLERGVTTPLIAAGVPVVGFSQLRYLLRKRSPDRVGADLGRIIAAYRAKWHRNSVVVIGYSRGAGIVPFAVARLPAAQRDAVKAVVLIGAEHTAGFHLGLRDLVGSGPWKDELPVMPELRQLGAATIVCFYGEAETDTLCPELAAPAITVRMPGGHHFDGRYGDIGNRIVQVVQAAAKP